ncbi:MAG: ACT domain-containing protein [Candidatus Brocadiia bacterium]
MRVVQQLSVFLENKPGTLAEVCEALGQRGINMLAITVADTVDHAVVRLVPDRAEDAVHMLGNAGMLVVENPVLMVDISNEPGALGRIAQRLALAGINIEYAYCTVSKGQDTGALVLRVEDIEEAGKVLAEE